MWANRLTLPTVKKNNSNFRDLIRLDWV